MTPMTLGLSRRFPQPMLFSVRIHSAVVAGLFYTSVCQIIELPAPTQPIPVTTVVLADLELSQVVRPSPEPVVKPELESEPIPGLPKEAPMVIEKLKPESKSRPKPVKKVQEQPKHDVEPMGSCPASPFENTAPIRLTLSTVTAAISKSTTSVASGPRASSHNQPQCPVQAQTLRIEGQVKAKPDATPDGRVDNVQILSVKSVSMFEYEVRSAMRRRHYEPGKLSGRIVVNILFKINGTTEI